MLISASSETPVFSCERYLDILFINAEVALIRKLQPHIALVFEKYNFLAGNEISFICYIPTVDGRGCVLIDLQPTQEVGWW